MPSVPTTREAIKRALTEHGPMTKPEIIEVLGLKKEAVLSSMRAAREKGTTHFRIVEYRRQLGHGGLLSPVFAVGPGADIPKPPVLGASARIVTLARYRELHRAQRRLYDIKRRGSTMNPFSQLIKRKEA